MGYAPSYRINTQAPMSATPIEAGLRSIRINLKEAGQGCSRSPLLKRCIASITWRATLFQLSWPGTHLVWPRRNTMGTTSPDGKVPRRSFSIAMAFDCNSLRWVSSIRSFWLRSVLTCTGRYTPTRII